MKKCLISLLMVLISALAQAEIKVQVDPAQVIEGESFKLSLIFDTAQNGGVPNLAPLQKDFVILGTERNVSYSIINGQTQSSSQWVIALRAKKAGTLTIPALKVGLEESAPLTLTVQDRSSALNNPDLSAQNEDVMLSGEVNEKTPFVNQQITYTVKLYHSKRLLDANYQGPHADDALVIPLGEEKTYQTVLNNTNYIVEEQSYAVFPQKSGVLNLISPTFTAVLYDLDAQRVRVQDKTIKLKVQPIPKNYQGKVWLPAEKIKLSEHYEDLKHTLNQGSTLTRIVTIEGVAIPAQLVPVPAFEQNENFNVYPEKGTEQNQLKQGQLVGTTQIKVTYLFNKAGQVRIPELRLPWFNTKTGKEETASLPSQNFDIKPAATPATNTSVLTPSADLSERIKDSTAIAQVSQQSGSILPWIIALGFALIWIVTLGLWLWSRRNRENNKKQYKNALETLKKACFEHHPARVRDALLKWASLHWPDALILNLGDLNNLVRDPQLKKQLHFLSQALYKNDQNQSWRGEALFKAVQATRPAQTRFKKKNKVLPPINPLYK